MGLHAALDDARLNRDHPTRFPGERRTTKDLFSGSGGRLVHVDRTGQLRDFSYPLSGLNGIVSSRFGLKLGDQNIEFDEFANITQSYHDDTTLVESTYRWDSFTVSRYDFTLGRAHVTHIDLSGEVPPNPTLWTHQRYAPDGQESRVGRLVHEDAVEIFHRNERNILHSSTPIATNINQPRQRHDDVLESGGIAFPAQDIDLERREDTALGGNVILEVELLGDGDSASTTLVSLLSDHSGIASNGPLDRTRSIANSFGEPSQLRAAAEDQNRPHVPDGHPSAGVIRSDLRVLQLLSAPSGARIAGPDFDPYYVHSGGYGYTWFRDDAEISRFLLEAEHSLDLSLAEWHADSARFYCRTQRDDGTWPHRVWADTGELAPGWANGRLESGRSLEYQADQTASVVAFLATYLRERDPDHPGRIEAAIVDGLDGLDATLSEDGLPAACQNAWENETGRFVHTAATFLDAFASVARAPMADTIRDQAHDYAHSVANGLTNFWITDREIYATRLSDGELHDGLDASTFTLTRASAEYAELTGGLDRQRLRRLSTHIETTIDGLYRESEAVAGLCRFEGDEWRRRSQVDEKIWTVSTTWGAKAAAELSTLRSRADKDPEPFDDKARLLLDLVLPDGSLCMETGYLPEQVFDEGSPDSATPLGWPHAMRLATIAHLQS